MAAVVEGFRMMVFKQAAFYAKAAVDHGGMAVYYVKQLATGRDSEGHVLADFSLTWAYDHLIIEAITAWHFARLLDDDQVAAEIARQAAAQRLDDEIGF